VNAFAQKPSVSPQRAQAREMNNEFNAVTVSVTFESRPILLLIIVEKIESSIRANSI